MAGRKKKARGEPSNNGAVTIERGVPLPKYRRRKTYPWPTMEVGDSFTEPFTESRLRSLRTLAATAGKRYGRYFIVRLDPKDPSLIRVWRAE